jgi:hypothetical protein
LGVASLTASSLTIKTGNTFNYGYDGTANLSMTIDGDLDLAAEAIYQVAVGPATAATTKVTGAVNLSGTVKAAFANGVYAAKRYTILTATGSIAGVFDNLSNSNLPANVTASLSYNAHNAYLNLIVAPSPAPAPAAGFWLCSRCCW